MFRSGALGIPEGPPMRHACMGHEEARGDVRAAAMSREIRQATDLATQLRKRGIDDPRVLEAIGRVPREIFVGERQVEAAYCDTALPIGCGQTISQPFVVGY